MKNILYILFFVLSACSGQTDNQKKTAVEPQPAFWNDIQNFKKQDSVSAAPKNAILFIGSSSFTMWKDIKNYFPGYPIINRGFGGSTLLDQIRYANDIIYPYQPKQIIIYCGENDLASSDSVLAANVYQRFNVLFTGIRAKLPDVSIVFISLKPSPSRKHLFDKMKSANFLIRNYLVAQKNTAFVDVYSKMLNENGEPMPAIFLQDSLHMNANGYAIWKTAIEPHLMK